MSDQTYAVNNLERFMSGKGFERAMIRFRAANKENVPPVTPPRRPVPQSCTVRVNRF